MNTLRRLAIAFVVAVSTIGAVIVTVLLLLILGPVGLLLGGGLVVAAPLLGLRIARSLDAPREPLSRSVVIRCVWAALFLAVVGLPLVGIPLTEGDAMGGAVMIGLPLLVVVGTLVGVFWPSRRAV